MKRLLQCLALLSVFGPALAVAHDIGVSQSELIQKDGSRYSLSVQAGSGVGHLFPSPQLPKHCQFVGNPRGTQSQERQR